MKTQKAVTRGAAIYDAFDADKEGALLEFQIDDENDAGGSPCTVSVGHHRAVIMPIRLASRWPERGDDIEAAHALANAEAR